MTQPLLSVIIPAYNREHCLERAIRSIFTQEINGIEILLGDDASTDGTVALARSLVPDIYVTSLAVNSGAAAARNAVAAVASGQFFAFLDSDDEWMPGKLRAQLDFLNRNPGVGICACGHDLVRKDGSVRHIHGRNPDDWKHALAFSQSFHGASTPLIRREIWQQVGPQDESLRVLEDWDWMLRASGFTDIHVLARTHVRIHENRPSDPDFTRLSTERFLALHSQEFSKFGPGVHRRIISQHWENAARNWFLHGRFQGGCALLLRSLRAAPRRNPKTLAALPLALLDHFTGTKFLNSILTR